MTVVCSGSIAYDYILTFKGRFKDHILLDKTHILNLSFLVDDLQKRRGGVAGNYAYNLSLLGHPAAVLATAGTDAAEYRDRLHHDRHGRQPADGLLRRSDVARRRPRPGRRAAGGRCRHRRPQRSKSD